MLITLYIAISSDGFIADKNGEVGWLDAYNTPEIAGEIDAAGCGFKTFYDSVDALIIGYTTYKQVLTFGPWAFSSKTSYIFIDPTALEHDTQDLKFVSSDISTFMQQLALHNYQRVWLMGGAKLAESFYKLGLIDEYIITIVPTKLSEGIPLLPAIVQAEDMRLVNTKNFASGIVQKHYKRWLKV